LFVWPITRPSSGASRGAASSPKASATRPQDAAVEGAHPGGLRDQCRVRPFFARRTLKHAEGRQHAEHAVAS
jgi:hypothetical protein